MRKLTIEYRLNGFKRTIIRQVPQTWEELTPVQFLLVAKLYKQEISELDFLFQFYSFPKSIRNLDSFYEYHLTDLLSFLSDCRIRMNRFIIPKIGKLEAPADRLKGITLGHFMFIDTAFNHYARTENEAELDRLIAFLYLRRNEYVVLPNNPEKGLFSQMKPLILKKRLEEVAKFEPSLKHAVFLNYVFIKRWLSKAFPRLFPLTEDEDLKGADGKGKAKAPVVNWLDIFDAFVDDDIAQMEKYQQMPAATAFRLLDKRIRDAQNKKR